MYNYTNLSLTALIDKIGNSRFWDLPKMVAEALKKLVSRVEVLEDAPVPTGDFIPLAGTEVGSPVTGDIEFLRDNNFKNIFDGDLFGDFRKVSFEDDSNILSLSVSSNPNLGKIFISPNGIFISSNDITSKGIEGNEDYSANITELSFVQKKYVDERGSVFNATTATLSASDLNTAYPNAKDGFSVIAPNVIGGGKYYIKAGAGWVYQQILAVV